MCIRDRHITTRKNTTTSVAITNISSIFLVKFAFPFHHDLYNQLQMCIRDRSLGLTPQPGSRRWWMCSCTQVVRGSAPPDLCLWLRFSSAC